MRDERQTTYVRPVERRTPARKAETGTAASAKKLQKRWTCWDEYSPSTASKA